MPSEDGKPKQKIEAGDSSKNIQVAGDFHNHEAPRKSSLVVPTQEDIEEVNPRIREIKSAAKRQIYRHSVRYSSPRLEASGISAWKLVFWILLAVLIAATLL